MPFIFDADDVNSPLYVLFGRGDIGLGPGDRGSLALGKIPPMPIGPISKGTFPPKEFPPLIVLQFGNLESLNTVIQALEICKENYIKAHPPGGTDGPVQ